MTDMKRKFERDRAWRRANPDKVRIYNARNRAGKFGREYNNEWQRQNRKRNPIVYMLRNSKNRAKRLGVEFNLVEADIVIPEFCPVLGLKLEFGHGKGTGFFSPNSPSLDRFDNSRGYTRDNIKIISWRANMLKHDGTLDEHRRIVAYMESSS